MGSSIEIKSIAADKIADVFDHLFWPAGEADVIASSIREFGQLSPVLVAGTEEGYTLVAGRGRLRALGLLGAECLVRVVAADTPRERGLLYLADNGHRPLDDGMRLQALRFFSSVMDTAELEKDIFPRLGIKKKSKDAKLFRAWLQLPETWQSHLEAGRVPLAAGVVLTSMDENDLDVVESYFQDLSWSRSNAVNWLTWLFEASRMRGQAVSVLLEEAGMQSIMKSGLSPKDIIARLVAAAQIIRYPRLSQLRDTFVGAASEITAGTKWRMNQPNNFETGGAELTIQVRDAGQLKKAIEDLQAMESASAWETVWNPVGEHDE